MRNYRISLLLTIALLAMTSQAVPRYLRPDYPTVSMTDEERQQTITVTVIEHDILRVDVVPLDTQAPKLPSLVKEQKHALVPKVGKLMLGPDMKGA